MSSTTDLSRVRKLLEEQLTEEIMQRLMAHAVRKAQRLYWQGIRNGPMPGGDAHDVVITAVEKVWTGRRNWELDQQPDLFLYLKGVVDSEINNLVESKANRRLRVALPDVNTEDQPDDLVVPSVEEEESRREEERRSDDFFLGFYDYLNAEPDLQKILDCFFDGIVKPRKIAAKLDVNAKDIYNARKRLDKRLKAYRTAQQNAAAVGKEASDA